MIVLVCDDLGFYMLMSLLFLVRALSHRRQNARPQASGQVLCGRHDGAKPVQRGGKILRSLLYFFK